MPWWIWLILALFMLAMIVAGLIYAALHGIRALKDMSDIGGQIGERVAAMGESGTSADTSEPPLFTQPAQRGTESLCRGPCGRDSQQGRQARTPRPGMGPLEAIQQLTESSNGTSPTP